MATTAASTRRLIHRTQRGAVAPKLTSWQMNDLMAWYPMMSVTLGRPKVFRQQSGIGDGQGLLTAATGGSGTPKIFVAGSEVGEVIEFKGNSFESYLDGLQQAVTSSDIWAICCWFKITSTGSAQTLVSIYDEEFDGSQNSASITISSAGKIQGDYIRASSLGRIVGTGITVGKWHHAVFIIVSSDFRRLYLDGEVQGTDSTGLSRFGPGALSIGGGGDPDDSPDYAYAEIADVRIYNAFLEPAMIRRLANREIAWDLYQHPRNNRPLKKGL